MDDTLVLTSKLDLAAVSRVEALAQAVAPGADIQQTVAAWRQAFAATPWDDSKQVLFRAGFGGGRGGEVAC